MANVEARETPLDQQVADGRNLRWMVIAVAGSFALSLALVYLYIHYLPMNLTSHTRELTQQIEEFLNKQGIPNDNFTESAFSEENDSRAIWTKKQLQVNLPPQINGSALIQTLRRDLSTVGVVVMEDPEPQNGSTVAHFLLAGRPFLSLRLFEAAPQVPQTPPRDLTAPCQSLQAKIRALLSQNNATFPAASQKEPERREINGCLINWYDWKVNLPETLPLETLATTIETTLSDDSIAVRQENNQPGQEKVLIVSYLGLDFLKMTFVESDVGGASASEPQSDTRVTNNETGNELPLDSVEYNGNNNGAPPPEATTQTAAPARIAIIVDDGGYGGAPTEKILSLNTSLTLAILPFTPYAAETATRAAQLGFQVLIHMPMESFSTKTTFPGSVLTHMTQEEMRDVITRARADVPNAVGMNNHTGSKFTQNAEALSLFFAALKDTSLFFIDSRTTGKSKAFDTAVSAGIRARSSNLFLDNSPDADAILAQTKKLIALAQQHGSAIGICHFRHATAQVLERVIQEIQNAGVQLVHVSELVP